MPNACLTGDLVTFIEIDFWTSKVVAIIRAMWVIGGCLNKIGLLVARGRKRGFWVGICSLPISSQLIPLFNKHTQTRLGVSWLLLPGPVQGLQGLKKMCLLIFSPHFIPCLSILQRHSSFSFIFPPAGSMSYCVLSSISEPGSAWIHLSSSNIKYSYC